ncbi:5881_t:CDS:2 [Acaulospora morrowiae]|uniref:5881_t:CDS:1 n=1 Tax=Acaulospora morrowiae TaxID=94023 RepID=A0A9N9G594_9GLOM|nr:5881_t:CDS:2 [Acaulospora morrowiae]
MSDSTNNQHQITIDDSYQTGGDLNNKKEESTKTTPLEGDHPPPYEFVSADSAPAYSAASTSTRIPAPVSGSNLEAQRIGTRPEDSPIVTRNMVAANVVALVVPQIVESAISKANNDACRNLNPVNENIIYYSYDPNVYTNFSIDSSDSYIQNGDLLVSRDLQNKTNATIWVQMAAPGRAPANVDFVPQQSSYLMRFHQSSGGSNFLGLFGMSASCIKVRVRLFLPQRMTSPQTQTVIQADNFDIQTLPNDVIYNQSLNIKSTNGDILVNRLYANNVTLNTRYGDIFGSIRSLKNAKITSRGSINMLMNVAPDATNYNISATAFGYVALQFNKSFAGKYEIITHDDYGINDSYGTVGDNGTGTLRVESRGRAIVRFA